MALNLTFRIVVLKFKDNLAIVSLTSRRFSKQFVSITVLNRAFH